MSRHSVWGRLSRVSRRELGALLLLAVILSGAWGFAELADEVAEGSTRSADEAILLGLRDAEDPDDPIGPGWAEEIGRDLTALGGVAVLVLVTMATAGYLLLGRKPAAAAFLAAAVISGVALSLLLKSGFDRPRPDLVAHGSIVATASFPSGHSMLSAVVYLTLGALLARVHPERRLKVYFFGLALLVTVLVGCSRVYLGVHWPTDVLAGWTAGSLWALLCWSVALLLQRRGTVEDDDASAAPEEAEPT